MATPSNPTPARSTRINQPPSLNVVRVPNHTGTLPATGYKEEVISTPTGLMTFNGSTWVPISGGEGNVSRTPLIPPPAAQTDGDTWIDTTTGHTLMFNKHLNNWMPGRIHRGPHMPFREGSTDYATAASEIGAAWYDTSTRSLKYLVHGLTGGTLRWVLSTDPAAPTARTSLAIVPGLKDGDSYWTWNSLTGVNAYTYLNGWVQQTTAVMAQTNNSGPLAYAENITGYGTIAPTTGTVIPGVCIVIPANPGDIWIEYGAELGIATGGQGEGIISISEWTGGSFPTTVNDWALAHFDTAQASSVYGPSLTGKYRLGPTTIDRTFALGLATTQEGSTLSVYSRNGGITPNTTYGRSWMAAYSR